MLRVPDYNITTMVALQYSFMKCDIYTWIKKTESLAIG